MPASRSGRGTPSARTAGGQSTTPLQSSMGLQAPKPAPVTMVVLGDPCTHPYEDDCIVPTSPDIESEAKE
jgi:hypothetical protein